MRYVKHASFKGRLVVLGFGSIGKAVLPLIFRHIDVTPERVKIISRSADKSGIAQEFGVDFLAQPLDEENYEAVLDAHLSEGDFLLNLSVDVSSLALMMFCWRRGVMYLDTCIEPWPGRYADPGTPLSRRTNYALREDVLAFRMDKRTGPTAVVTQGANPGLASAFVKQALYDLATDAGLEFDRPACHEDWAVLARKLDIKVIHIAERDTQVARRRKRRGEFVNTWSVAGFLSEGLQPSELGWGTHEKHWPEGAARHGYGCDAAIFLDRPGAATRVRSWTPLEGSYHGFLITHGESISIADHLTVREDGKAVYRPTVHYAYHPCDDAVLSLHELAGKNWEKQKNARILRDDVTTGIDELGVLLMGHEKGAYWYGSRLSTQQARELVPHNTATSLQVVAGIVGGMVWALKNPRSGVVEPDDLDHDAVLDVARPYLGELVGVRDAWTPLRGRTDLFKEDIDAGDPWQFLNFRVA